MANDKRKIDFEEEGPDLAPGFFSSYGYEDMEPVTLTDSETGERFKYINGKKVIVND